MSSKPCILVVGDFINYHILACMDKIQWIEKLKELKSGFVWDGNKATRFLTKEEMCLAQSFVEKETLGAFCYQPNDYGYPGNIMQCKKRPWKELYQTLVELPFCKCSQILIPWCPSHIEKFHIEPERIEAFIANGSIPVIPHVRKEDQYISVALYLSSRFEPYDEDGYGGGDVDEYAVAVIDKEGRLAYPFTHCVDIHLNSTMDISSNEFLSDIKRKSLF